MAIPPMSFRVRRSGACVCLSVLARLRMDWFSGCAVGESLTGVLVFLGLEGSAEPVGPLNEEELDVVGKVGVGAGDVSSQLGKSVKDTLAAASDDLSLFTKLAVFAVIVGVCVAYVKMHSPRRTGHAGRHGAYEKSSYP